MSFTRSLRHSISLSPAPYRRLTMSHFGAFQLVQYVLYLVFGEDDWETRWFLGAVDILDPAEMLIENISVKEQDSAEGLVLGGSSDVSISREV
jgi:hypothetical protein